MAWEFFAIWAIIIATTVWFVRDERRLLGEKLKERALHFATAPGFQHRAVAATAAAPIELTASTEIQRRFRQAMLRR